MRFETSRSHSGPSQWTVSTPKPIGLSAICDPEDPMFAYACLDPVMRFRIKGLTFEVFVHNFWGQETYEMSVFRGDREIDLNGRFSSLEKVRGWVTDNADKLVAIFGRDAAR